MKKVFSRVVTILMAVIAAFGVLTCGVGCQASKEEDVQTFYDIVVQSQELLDACADDIYSCWYDAIYKDKYSGSIDLAIASAVAKNYDNIAIIESNDELIKGLYKEIRDSEVSEEVQAVMHAYSDYYEFVINVSGSFNSFSSGKETKKKELASALKNLEFEI